MPIPVPDSWRSSLDVLGRTLTYNPDQSTGKVSYSDPAEEIYFEYHPFGLDGAGERIVVSDYRAAGPDEWTYQRAIVGWHVNPVLLANLATVENAPAWDVGPEEFPILRSSANEKFADDIREAVKALMEADPYYSDLPIVTQRLQDLDATIDETVQLAGGIIIVLVVVTLEEPLPNLPGANFNSIKLVARVIENLNLNATGKGAQAIAIYTAALWSQLKPDALTNPLKLEAIDLGNDPRGLTFDVTAATSGGTKIEIPRLEDVTIDASNLAAIALANPKPGAAIFYTLNGSTPAPRNPAAAVYLATFNSAPGVTVRARAWLAGYIPSAELRQVL